MKQNILSLIGLILGVITFILGLSSGFGWAWGEIGIFAGAGLIVTNLNAGIEVIKKFKK